MTQRVVKMPRPASEAFLLFLPAVALGDLHQPRRPSSASLDVGRSLVSPEFRFDLARMPRGQHHDLEGPGTPAGDLGSQFLPQQEEYLRTSRGNGDSVVDFPPLGLPSAGSSLQGREWETPAKLRNRLWVEPQIRRSSYVGRFGGPWPPAGDAAAGSQPYRRRTRRPPPHHMPPPPPGLHNRRPGAPGPRSKGEGLLSTQDLPPEVLQLLPETVAKVYQRYAPTPTTTTTAKPPVVWFPDLNKECASPGGSGGGGFNAFTVLAMVVSLVNLVSILDTNANNNNNNNNDNNNLNNDNIQVGNENNNNNNLDLLTMVSFGGRRRRRRHFDVAHNHTAAGRHAAPAPDEVAAGVGVLFMRAWYQATLQEPTRPQGVVVVATAPHHPDPSEKSLRWEISGQFETSSTSPAGGGSSLGSLASRECVMRSLCEANHASAWLGPLARDVAEVLSVSFVDLLLHPESGSWKSSLLRAAGRGRSGWDCQAIYACDPTHSLHPTTE
ncbi:uncharacterized protein [Panulirus ornatus]|uniref:uncharacterized protein n=1 Tax=Panulirus ornatus TaxID=150431 RepID=UPI003A896DDD